MHEAFERLEPCPDQKIKAARYRHRHNGLEVIIWEERSAPVVAYQTWFRVGSRHDPVGYSGMAHFFEHLMFKATKTRPEGMYDKSMEALGAETNAATWVDWTYYTVKAPAWHLAEIVAIEADRMANLALDEDMLEREREVVLNERLMTVDNQPDGELSEALYAEVFKVHPYGLPTIGWEEDIRRIDLQACEAFYRRHYAPNQATIVLVGDVDTAEALTLIEAHYGGMGREAEPEIATVVEPPIEEARRLERHLPIAASRFIRVWHAPEAAHPDYLALEMISDLLTGGLSARLERVLVDEHELAMDVSAWLAGWRDPSVFEIAVTLRPELGEESLAEVERILMAELEALAAAEVLNAPGSPPELKKVKHGFEADFYRQQSDVEARARTIGHLHVTVGSWREFWREVEAVRALTSDDLRRAFQRWILGAQHVTAVAWAEGEVEDEA